MSQQNPYGLQQSEIINPGINRTMNDRISMQQIGYSNNMMNQDNYNSNMQNNYMPRNTPMYMSTRGQMTNRTMNPFGMNDYNKTLENTADSQQDSHKTPRTKSKKNIKSKRNVINKSKSRNIKGMNLILKKIDQRVEMFSRGRNRLRLEGK